MRDGEDSAHLTDRPELLQRRYRMLGSVHDAALAMRR